MTERFQEVNVRCVLRTSLPNEDVQALTTKQITDMLNNGSSVVSTIETGQSYDKPEQITNETARKHFSLSSTQQKKTA